MDADALLAKQLYNRQSDEFAKKQNQYTVLVELKEKIYSTFLSQVDQKKILFAGCGDGSECLPVIDKGAMVIGIDISERLIELARQNCPLADFEVMDIEKMSFENNTFDTIVSFFSVMYKENLRAVLEEFSRVLKNDGCMIIAVPHPVRKMMKYNAQNYFITGRRDEIWKGVQRFGYYRLLEDYINTAFDAGLKVTQLMEPKPVKEPGMSDAEVSYPHFAVFKLMKDH